MGEDPEEDIEDSEEVREWLREKYRDWYADSIHKGSVTFKAIEKIRTRPMSYKNFIKHLKEHTGQPHTYIGKMKKGLLMAVDGKRVSVMDKGLVLYTAASINLSPLEFMILSYLYRSVKAEKFFTRKYSDFIHPLHTLTLNKVSTVFYDLAKQGFLKRLSVTQWTIPPEKMRFLSKYEAVIDKAVRLTYD